MSSCVLVRTKAVRRSKKIKDDNDNVLIKEDDNFPEILLFPLCIVSKMNTLEFRGESKARGPVQRPERNGRSPKSVAHGP